MYELQHRDAESGSNLYVTLRRPDGSAPYWNSIDEEFQTLDPAKWQEYVIALTESPAGSYLFRATLPPIAGQMTADWYWADVFYQADVAPVISDERIAGYMGYWNGTRFRFWSPDDEQTLTQLATLLAPLLWQNPIRTVTDVLGKVLGGGSSTITGVGVRSEEVAAITSVAADAVTGATQIFLDSVSGIEAGSLIRVGWSPWTPQQLAVVTEVYNPELPLMPSIRFDPPLVLDAFVNDTVEVFRGKHLNRFNFSDTPGTSALLARLSAQWAASVQASDATVAKQNEILAAVVMRAIGEHAIAVRVTACDAPLQHVLIRTFDGQVLVDRQFTDANGECTLQLDAGTYRVVATRTGWQSQTIAELVVTEPAELELELELLSIPASSTANRCTGYAYCYDEDGDLVEGETVYAQVVRAASGSGEALDASQRAETSDSGGLVTFTELRIGAAYLFRYRDAKAIQHKVTIAAANVVNGLFALPNFHG